MTAKDKETWMSIWVERGNYSEISGAMLPYWKPIYFSHLVTKAARPDLRHYKYNIVLMTEEEHIMWENHRHKLRGKKEWDWVFARYERIKTMRL